MGWHLDGRVTACVGTHTHVPTADGRVLPGGTAYITDVGMTGARNGVIGVKREQALERFIKLTNVRFETADEEPWLNAVLVEADGEGRATGDRTAAPAGAAVARAPRAPGPRAAPRCGAATSASASGSRVDHVEVVSRELDLRQNRGQRRWRPRARAMRQANASAPSGSAQITNCGESTLPNRAKAIVPARLASTSSRGVRPTRAASSATRPHEHAGEERRHRSGGVMLAARRIDGSTRSPRPRRRGHPARAHHRRRALDLHRSVEVVADGIRGAVGRDGHGGQRHDRDRGRARERALPAPRGGWPRATSQASATGTATSGKQLRHRAEAEHGQPGTRAVAAEEQRGRRAGCATGKTSKWVRTQRAAQERHQGRREHGAARVAAGRPRKRAAEEHHGPPRRPASRARMPSGSSPRRCRAAPGSAISGAASGGYSNAKSR